MPTGVTEVALLIPDPDEVHEDEAALRLAAAVAGPGVTVHGPVGSRVDLFAAHAGLARIHASLVTRMDRIDGIAVFTIFDGQLVEEGSLVASVKTGPHLVQGSVVARAEAIAASGSPLVDVRPFQRRRVTAIVKTPVAPRARDHFESALRSKVESLGSTLAGPTYVENDVASLTAALERAVRGRDRADLVLVAGSGTTDPSDPIFVALARLGGNVTSHGVPAHPGSMAWLGRCKRTTILGLPSCGAYSVATAADLLLPWMLAGEPPTRRTVARLGHGGILTREMRFRFPPYARTVDRSED